MFLFLLHWWWGWGGELFGDPTLGNSMVSGFQMANNLIQVNSSFSKIRPATQQFQEQGASQKQNTKTSLPHKILKRSDQIEVQKMDVHLNPTIEEGSWMFKVSESSREKLTLPVCLCAQGKNRKWVGYLCCQNTMRCIFYVAPSMQNAQVARQRIKHDPRTWGQNVKRMGDILERKTVWRYQQCFACFSKEVKHDPVWGGGL